MKIKTLFTISSFSAALLFPFSMFAQSPPSAREVQKAAIESQFLQHMIEHHQQGVEMANVALTKSKDKNVIQISQNIVQQQSKEITQMQAWRNRWYFGEKLNPEMPRMDMKEIDTKTGTDYDKAYLMAMSEHHENAIGMAKKVLPNLEHQEVKDFAQSVIRNQSIEIKQMKKAHSSI